MKKQTILALSLLSLACVFQNTEAMFSSTYQKIKANSESAFLYVQKALPFALVGAAIYWGKEAAINNTKSIGSELVDFVNTLDSDFPYYCPKLTDFTDSLTDNCRLGTFKIIGSLCAAKLISDQLQLNNTKEPSKPQNANASKIINVVKLISLGFCTKFAYDGAKQIADAFISFQILPFLTRDNFLSRITIS